MQFDRILFTTDLSPNSMLAIPHVAGLATLYDADVTVAYVVGSQGSTRRATPAVLDATAEAALLTTMGAFSGGVGRVRRQVVLGDPEVELLRMLDYGEYDLCVCTKHGAQATGLLVGSTTQVLVEQAPVPVLAVHGPLTPGARVEMHSATWRDIVVATDFSAPSVAGMRQAVELAQVWDATLHFVHVLAVPGLVVVEGNKVALPEVPEHMRAKVNKREAELAALLRPLRWPKISHSVICADEAATGLIATALRAEADVVVIPSSGAGAMQRLVLGSTAARLIRLSPLPVLVLRG